MATPIFDKFLGDMFEFRMNHSQQLFKHGLIWFSDHENMGLDTFLLLLAYLVVEKMLKNEILVMAALISILLEMLKGDAMSSTGFSIRTTWATRISKEKNFISRIQVHPHIKVWHPES